MRRGALLVAIAASVVAASCATRAFVRPAGSGVPAPEAAAAWADATTNCRPVASYVAGMGLTGLVGRQRIRLLASATLDAVVTAAGQIGLEARVSGQLAFKLGGTADRAVLLLDDRVVTARADDIVEALVGIKIGPERLLAVLTGCVSMTARLDAGQRYGDTLWIATGDAVVFLQPRAASWELRAGYFDEFEVDYRSFRDGFPKEIALTSRPSQVPLVSLSLKVRHFELNPTLGSTAFNVIVPEDAGMKAMSLEELRQSGPLGATSAVR